MPFHNEKIKKLLDHYKTLWALYHVSGLAEWDLNTYMPDEGAPGRGEALAKISTLAQKIFLDEKFVALIHETGEEKGLTNPEAAVVRCLRRDLKKYQKLPPEFLEEFERVTNEAHMVWRDAKKEKNFPKFAPCLEKIVDLVRRKADHLGYEDHPYDALIDEFEEGWTVKDLDAFFMGYRNELKDILDKIRAHPDYSPESPLSRIPYGRTTMEEINREILAYLHVNPKRLRLDVSAHPFTSGLSHRDVRITTWYGERDFGSSVTSTIHEFGHALYNLQVDEALSYTPLESPRSLGLHESQSRFWENMIARSRAFAERFMGPFKNLSGEMRQCLDEKGEDAVYRYFNLVRPGPIRVEADEVTYHFHIILRYYLEKSLVEGRLQVKDLPEVWNLSMERYLGVVPPDNAQGVLQDIHWSMGAIGYFPTYSLGTFLAAMWREAMEEDFGDLDVFLHKEEAISSLQEWLREKVHRHGNTYSFKDLVKRSLGKDFSTAPMLKYLRKKYLG